MSYPNSYLRGLNYPQGERQVAKLAPGGRSAVLPDGTMLRITPAGQDDVGALVHAGDVVRANYGAGGMVYSVSKYHLYGLTVYGILYVDLDVERTKTGKVKASDLNWLNELVAQDGKIKHLFEVNEDEVEVVRSSLIEVLI